MKALIRAVLFMSISGLVLMGYGIRINQELWKTTSRPPQLLIASGPPKTIDDKVANALAMLWDYKVMGNGFSLRRCTTEDERISLLLNHGANLAISSGHFVRSRQKDQPQEGNLKMLIPLYERFLYLLAKNDSGLQTSKDLKGLKVCINSDQHAETEWLTAFVQCRGVQDIRASSAHLVNCLALICSGDIDAILGFSDVETLSEAYRPFCHELKFVTLGNLTAEEEQGLIPGFLPHQILVGDQIPIATYSDAKVLLCDDRLSAELGFKLSKVSMGFKRFLAGQHPVLKQLSPEMAQKYASMGIELHEGTLRYLYMPSRDRISPKTGR